MRILWVKIGGLWPPTSGGRLRSFHIVRELAREHEITVLTTHQPGEDPELQKRHLADCLEVTSFPHAPPKRTQWKFLLYVLGSWLKGVPIDVLRHSVPALRREVEARLDGGAFDLCVADFLFAVPNIPLAGRVPVVLFAHNVEHMIWKRISAGARSPLRRVALSVEWRRSRRYEAAACRAVSRTIAVSGADKAAFSDLAPGVPVGEVPTGVDLDAFAPRGCAENPCELVYVGSMDWYPNEDAVNWFIGDILPRIRRGVPAATLTIVGRNPSDALCTAAKAAGATVTGTVDDVRDYLARAALCVVPLRIGGGTRLKIFEALAMGKATVSTSVGAEGLPVTAGRHLLVADSAEAFADAVSELLRDPSRRRRLGTAGRRLVVERYGWRQVASRFAVQCKIATRGRAAPIEGAPACFLNGT